MKYVDIESRFCDIVLRLTPVPHPWDTSATRPALDVQLTAPNFDVSQVYIEDDAAPQSFIEFCRELADNHKGWDGDRHWQSLAGALKIRADHDQINATRLYVTLSGGVDPQWTAQAELHVDPFRFDRVAINLELYGGELVENGREEGAEPQRIVPQGRTTEAIRKIGSPATMRQAGY